MSWNTEQAPPDDDVFSFTYVFSSETARVRMFFLSV